MQQVSRAQADGVENPVKNTLATPGSRVHTPRAMSDDQFTKLFKYMQLIRAEIEDLRTEMHDEFDRVYGLFDAHEKRMETLEHEQFAMKRQLTRHDDWIDRADQEWRTGVYNHKHK